MYCTGIDNDVATTTGDNEQRAGMQLEEVVNGYFFTFFWLY
jgi:hypothetical protein